MSARAKSEESPHDRLISWIREIIAKYRVEDELYNYSKVARELRARSFYRNDRDVREFAEAMGLDVITEGEVRRFNPRKYVQTWLSPEMRKCRRMEESAWDKLPDEQKAIIERLEQIGVTTLNTDTWQAVSLIIASPEQIAEGRALRVKMHQTFGEEIQLLLTLQELRE